MHIVFMGSPQFAVPILRALATAFEVVGVVTRPDRPAGRGRALRPPPVRLAAAELALPCLQSARISGPEGLAALRAWDPEIIVVAAFGEILNREVLELPRLGCVNVHASLLPRWRGASPIQAAILHGDHETGVTLMRMDEGLDTGPILAQSATAIGPEETAGDLGVRLAPLGAGLLVDALPRYAGGELLPRPQPSLGVTFAPRLRVDSGRLDFTLPAQRLARQVRAFQPWPTSFFEWKARRIVVRSSAAVPGGGSPAGQVVTFGAKPAVTTADGWLILERVQAAGGKPMSGEEFLRGARGLLGTNLIPAQAPAPASPPERD